MSDNEHDDVQTFVRKGPDGEQQSMTLVPWQGAAGAGAQEAATEGGPVAMMVIRIGGGGGQLRHLSYDDPPGEATEQEWRELLSQAVQTADDEQEFVQMLVFVLGMDLVRSHGCHPHEAIPAIVEFARKVYQEYSI